MLNVAQLVLPVHDIVDEELRSNFPDIAFHKCGSADELARVMPQADILFVNNQSYTADVGRVVMGNCSRLKWVQFATVGIDTARTNGLPKHVLLTNVRGLRTKILAGHAIALMLGVMRGFHAYETFRTRHEWGRMEMFPLILTPEGGTMVILGLGDIGQEIARKAKTFDMHIVGVSRGAEAHGPIDEVVSRERLSEVLSRADVLVIAMPLDETTRNYVGAEQLDLLKHTAVVVNISRGGVVDEKAMIKALRANKFAGLGTDVAEIEPMPSDNPLWEMHNVLLTPHLGGRGGEAQKVYLSKILATNLKRFQNGERLYNQIAYDGSIIPGNVEL